MKITLCFLYTLLLFPSLVFSKILIFTYQCSYPDFFELQCKALKKFCKDDYQFVVFDDAKNAGNSWLYKQICQKYGALYYRVDPSIHTYEYQPREPEEGFDHPSVRNCNAVEFSLRALGRDHDDLLFLLDGDLVPIKAFSLRAWMQDYDIMGLRQSRQNTHHPIRHADYLWIGFSILDMKSLPEKTLINFNCGKVDGVPVDPGGHMHHYLAKYSDIIHLKEIGASIICEADCDHDSLDLATFF